MRTIVKRLPDFLHGAQLATFAVAESSMITVFESASQTGAAECISHPSANPDMEPHTLHSPVERHLLLPYALGHLPIVVPSPGVTPSKKVIEE